MAISRNLDSVFFLMFVFLHARTNSRLQVEFHNSQFREACDPFLSRDEARDDKIHLDSERQQIEVLLVWFCGTVGRFFPEEGSRAESLH